jgi:prepilin-type N-terminal cleavage/methylation domain-containing protein
MNGTNKKRGFTIIELLTVMSIIIILISILVPALNRVRIYAKVVTQKGQFFEISKGLEMYRNDHRDTLPDSGPADTSATPPTVGYCGAMKLCEAMLGQDGMGFHPSSRFWADGTWQDPNLTIVDLYPLDLCTQIDPTPHLSNLREREKYLEREHFKATRLQDLYQWSIGAPLGVSYGPPFDPAATFNAGYHNAVICDVFLRGYSRCIGREGEKLGMPVLYYKANPSKLSHDPNGWNTNTDNIYNFDDNYAITALGCSWETTYVTDHPMFTNPGLFYKAITNERITTMPKPHNEDGYILMSAGYDGLYGTRDDVFNFAE